MRTWVIRSVVLIAAGLVTLPSVRSAWDRSAAERGAPPAVAGSPRSLDGFRRRAADSLSAGEFGAAAADARVVLASTPLDRSALRILSMAEEGLGHAERSGEVAIDASFASRRDPYTQLRLLRLTLGSGDLDEAARRADALGRIDGFRGEGFDGLNAVLSERGGAAAVATRLATRPPWRADYLDRLGQEAGIAPARVFEVLDRLGRSSAPPSAEETNRVLLAMVRTGRGVQAWTYWRARHPAGTGLIDDPDLVSVRRTGSDQGMSPFEWSLLPDTPVQVLGSRDGSGEPALVAEYDGERSPRFVSRWVGVAPGRYRFSYRAAGPAAENDRLHPEVSCTSGATARIEPVERNAGAPATAAFSMVVPPDCALLRLAFTLEAAEAAAPADFSIRDVTLDRPSTP